MAAKDGHWDRAQFLELVEADQEALLSKDEEHLIAREQELAWKLEGRGSASSSSKGWWPSGKGKSGFSHNTWKGGGAKGKTFKGKGKGKKSPWQAKGAQDEAQDE